MTKELEKQETRELTTNQALEDSGISTNDLLISRIGIMNALSQLVKDGSAMIGDIMDIGAEEKLGNAQDPVDFLVLKSFKYWTQTKDKEFVKGSIKPATSQNEIPWEEPGGIKNIFNHSFYILLKKDLDTGITIPYTINFRSTEIKKAKRICTILYRMAQQRVPSFGNYFTLSTKEERKGTDSWAGAKISVGEPVPKDVQVRAKEILDSLNKAEREGVLKHTEENIHAENNGDF